MPIYNTNNLKNTGGNANLNDGIPEVNPEYVLGNGTFKIPNVETPAANPQLNALSQRMYQQAQDYRAAIPQMGRNAYNSYESGARKNLQQGIKQTQKDYNKRGLLNSGARIGSEYKAKANNASDLSSARYNINQNLLNNADTLEGNALNSSYSIMGSNPNLGAASLGGLAGNINQQIGNMQNQQQLYNSVGQGIGTLAGSMYKSSYTSPST